MTGRAARRRRAVTGVLAVLASVLPAAGLLAQHDDPPEPAAYALENATVAHADGRVEGGVTVVLRGTLIEGVGPGVDVPPDARTLEGEDLRVYPGLIDAWGRAKLALPAPPKRSEVVAWNPSRTAQGFTPHLRVVDHLRAVGGDLREARRKGVVASAVFPDRGLAAGRGAVLLHRRSAGAPRDLVAVPEVGLALSLQGSPGAYPRTLMGVIAHHRQSFADARRRADLWRAYERDPTGMTTPRWDPDHGVLLRVADGGLRAFFRAHRAEDIRRVLALADEVGFTPVIVGGGEAWKVADELAARGVPVLVSLDFPEPREWEPERDEAARAEALEPAEARERERLVDLYSNAGRLSDAGVRFALTSGGGVADLREGARKAVEHGLTEDGALRALTAEPARILGIGPVARLTPGSGATLVVTDGPLLDADTRILYTFVEGELETVGESGPGGGSVAEETDRP